MQNLVNISYLYKNTKKNIVKQSKLYTGRCDNTRNMIFCGLLKLSSQLVYSMQSWIYEFVMGRYI